MVSPALLPNTASSIVDQNGRATQEFRDFLIRLGAASDGDLLQHEIDALAVRVAALENAPAIDAVIAGLYSIQSFGSLASGVVQIYLRGDTNNLGPTMVYGTDEASSRAWVRVFDMLAAGAGIEITDSGYRVLGVVETSADIPGAGTVGDAYRVLELSEAGLWAWDGAAWVLDAAATGVVGVQLETLANTGVGVSPVKIYTRDTYGRIEGDEDADTDDLPEGTTNLYFTAARVRATVLTGLSLASSAVISATDTVLSALGKLQAQITALTATISGLITQTITDGDTTHAPSGDAVFDALASKQDADQSTSGQYVPTVTPLINIASASGLTINWTRTDSAFVLSGSVQATATIINSAAAVTISLPISTTFGADGNICGGVAACKAAGVPVYESGQVFATASASTITLLFFPTSTNLYTMRLSIVVPIM
ncbi:MAG TPA: hypothetical protein VFH85_07800 [Gammaproteobacteria bacterium]|nr:hypothetical protein [Gammaproteobacteria bacterium]